MALTEAALVPWTPVGPRRCRLFFVDFLVRIWRLNAWERLMLPLPRTRKRFFAPLLVFILGMTVPIPICCPRRCSPWERLWGSYRPRACLGDVSLLTPSWEPAASPSAGPRAWEIVRRRCKAPDRRGRARA